MGFLADVQREVRNGDVPALPLRYWALFLGILNFFFFGWCVVFFLGGVCPVGWGILDMYHDPKHKTTRGPLYTYRARHHSHP